MVHRFMRCVAQYLSNLGVLCLPSRMELWKIHHQIPHEIVVIHDQLLGLEAEIMVLHEMVSDQDRSLHMYRVTTWVVQL